MTTPMLTMERSSRTPSVLLKQLIIVSLTLIWAAALPSLYLPFAAVKAFERNEMVLLVLM